MYYDGQGVEQSYDKALECFRQAADMGSPYAINNIGDMYENGTGVEQDYEKAAEYYRQAYEMGVAESLDSLKALVEAGHLPDTYMEGLVEAEE